MSVTYFIGPFDPALFQDGEPDPLPTSDFHISPGEYLQRILEHWPNATSHFGTVGSWELDEPGMRGIHVFLLADLQHVSFGFGANFTEFILWHRQIVPADYPLYLFNDTSWDSLILDMETTREEIQHFTNVRDF